MYLIEARNLANAALKEHGLTEQGWRFGFDQSKVRFGLCNYRKKTITLSGHLVSLNDESHVLQTLRHEIAHALVGWGHHHDAVWRAKAIEIGATGNRCYSEAVTRPEKRWEAACSDCGPLKIYRHKRLRNRRHRCVGGGQIHWIPKGGLG